MQSSCIGSLMEIASKDSRVLYLTADSGEGGLDIMFRRNFPSRSFEYGIAEENMIAAAAGLASTGKIPYVYTAAPFIAYRAYEFVRDDVCLQNMPVKLIGTGSGISVSALGPTHHTTEDINVLRNLPNLTLLSPATPKQAFEAVRYAYDCDGPVYIRLGLNGEKEFFDDDYVIPENGIDLVERDVKPDVIFFSTGSILEESIEAAYTLKERGKKVAVVNVFLLSPIDKATIIQCVENEETIVCVIEEHSIVGGLGSIILEIMQEYGMRNRLIRIGLDNTFAKGYGKIKQLRKENGLDAESIYKRVEKLLDE